MRKSGNDYTIPSTVTAIGNLAFIGCTGLTTVTIPNSVISIGNSAFIGCTGLTKITIPESVTTIADNAFAYSTNLTGVCFEGNAPAIGRSIFARSTNVTVCYLPGTTGWGDSFGDRPTAPWYFPNPRILSFGSSFGVRTNRFGFIISWATNASVRVETSTNLANLTWLPVSTNTLTDGWSYFGDPGWTSQPTRFYRLRSP